MSTQSRPCRTAADAGRLRDADFTADAAVSLAHPAQRICSCSGERAVAVMVVMRR